MTNGWDVLITLINFAREIISLMLTLLYTIPAFRILAIVLIVGYILFSFLRKAFKKKDANKF